MNGRAGDAASREAAGEAGTTVASTRGQPTLDIPGTNTDWMPLCRTDAEFDALQREARHQCWSVMGHRHGRMPHCGAALARAETVVAEKWGREWTTEGWYTKRGLRGKPATQLPSESEPADTPGMTSPDSASIGAVEDASVMSPKTR